MPAPRTVQQRLDDARSTDAALATHADEAADALHDALAPHLQDDEALTRDDLRLVLALVRRRYAAAAETLADAAGTLADETGEDAAARDERDEAFSDALGLMTRFKATVRTQFGDAFFRTLPIESHTPRQADRLLAEAERLLGWLDQDGTAFPASDNPFAPALAKADVRAALGPATERLRDALAGLGVEERQTEAALLDKDASLDAFDDIRSATRTLLKGLFRSVGRADVADRV